MSKRKMKLFMILLGSTTLILSMVIGIQIVIRQGELSPKELSLAIEDGTITQIKADENAEKALKKLSQKKGLGSGKNGKKIFYIPFPDEMEFVISDVREIEDMIHIKIRYSKENLMTQSQFSNKRKKESLGLFRTPDTLVVHKKNNWAKKLNKGETISSQGWVRAVTFNTEKYNKLLSPYNPVGFGYGWAYKSRRELKKLLN